MKTKGYTKILSSAVAISLVLGSASFASAKGSDHGKSEHQQKGQVQEETENTNSEQNQQEEKDSKNKKEKKNQSKKDSKKLSKSKYSKTIQKRLNSVDSNINKLSQSINSFFGVNADGTIDKELSKKSASKKYKSYKGKLKAEINKLRAIDKQLSSDKRKKRLSDADYEILSTKSKELQKLAADEIERVKSLVEQSTTPKTDDDSTTTEQPNTEQPESDDNNEQADSQDNNEQVDSEDDGEQVDSVDEEESTDTNNAGTPVDTTTPTA